jgi:ParB family chromosome partitioning protein
VNQIIIKDGRRAIDQNKVYELAESIKQVGLFHPITVRADDNGNYTLIAGAHRLEAFKLLGKESIESKVIMKNDLQTELIEIDENLIRNELNYVQRSDLLTRKKEIYEELYPETKREATLKQNRNANIAEREKPSFVEDTAAKTGLSKRTIETEIQISKNVIPEAKPVLQEQNIPKTEAIKLARETPEEQKKIIPIFESGQTKKVEEAKKIIDPIDEEYDKIVKEIEAKDKRVKKVMKLLDYTQFLGITEQSIQEYFDVFPKNRDSFVKDLERLKSIIDETIEIFNTTNQIRRVK